MLPVPSSSPAAADSAYYLRLLAFGLVVGFLSALTVQLKSAQAPPAEQTPVFRTRTDLIQLDVSVLDRQGQPVRGLTADDFTVLKDGREQSVVAFAAIDVPSWAPGTAPWVREVGPDVASNRMDARRAVVIVIDDVQPPPAADPLIPLARTVANAAIDGLGPTDLGAVVYALNRSRGQEFTLDRTRLRAAVDRFIPAAPMELETPFSAAKPSGNLQMPSRLPVKSGACLYKDCVAEALATAGDVLGAWPGARKTVVLISRGRYSGEMDLLGEAEERRRMRRALQSANVTVYQFDPQGLQTARPEVTDFGDLAESTGGRTITDNNAPAGMIPVMFRENSSYYLLGLRAGDEPDGQFHRLKVSVNRSDVQVRTRSGYYSAKGPASKSEQQSALERALSGGLPAGDLPVSVSAVPFATTDKPGAAVALVARLDHDGDLQGGATMELVAAAFNDNWKQVAGATQRFTLPPPNVGARFSETALRLNLPPGRYEIRTAMRNTADNRVGSVYTSVTVPKFSAAPLSLSGLVLECLPGGAAAVGDLAPVVPPVRMTTLRQFSPDQRAAAVARVYQQRTKTLSSVRISARIVDGQDRVAFTTDATLEPTAFNADRQADYRLDLPIARLPRGEYLLTLDVSAGTSSARGVLRFSVRR